MSGKTISAWEVGIGQPDADKLVELCKNYGARIAGFYGEERMSRATDEQIISLLISRVIVTEDGGRHVLLRHARLPVPPRPDGLTYIVMRLRGNLRDRGNLRLR